MGRCLSCVALLVALSSLSARAQQTAVVFYVAHSDDFTIGMTGAAAEMKAAGHKVFLVVMTKPNNAALLNCYTGGSCWGESFHSAGTFVGHSLSPATGAITNDDVIRSLDREAVAAAYKSGVDRVFFANFGRGFDEVPAHNPATYTAFKDSLKPTFTMMNSRLLAAGFIPSHKVVSGCDPDGGGQTNSAHRAVAQAAEELRAAGLIFNDLKAYRIYKWWGFSGPVSIQTSWFAPAWSANRAARFAEHGRGYGALSYFPELGMFAAGYHSVPDLMDAAAADPYEYVDVSPLPLCASWP